MGKNVAVFVDVANIFYAAKAAGVDIDYVTLLKSATAGRDFVRAYAYTGLDPDNENQRNFHSFLARNSYKVVSKDIRKYGDGKVKANLDIELVVDLMKTARNLDVAIVVSGDGDFAPAIRAVQEMGVRVEVISFRGNTSSDLIEVADIFTDITQLARVDKSSSRSGRRVAGDDEDLSMTEVPDKQTEGTGAGRGRGGRGRGRGRPGEAEPVAARAQAATNGARDTAAAAGLTALPGEKLSKVAPTASEPVDAVNGDAAAAPSVDGEDDGGVDSEGRRRRRRRGGRGRGRGRGREAEAGIEPVAGPAAAASPELDDDEEEEEIEITAAPRGPRPTPFGSFWDSQLGVPSSRPSSSTVRPPADDEDFDEPEIPEYLIAEQRRGQQGRGGVRGGPPQRGGARGGRSGYNAAVDRERYGRGGGGGINRYPDVSAREPAGGASRGRPDSGFNRQDRPPRQDRVDRPDRSSAPRSSEPWSEVPEELEAMLRAQLAQTPKAVPSESSRRGSSRTDAEAAPAAGRGGDEASAAIDVGSTEPATKRRSTRKKAEPASAAAAATSGEPADASGDAPKRRAPRRKADAPAAASDESSSASGTGETTAPKRRTTRAKPSATASSGDVEGEATETAAPRRRTTRKKAETA